MFSGYKKISGAAQITMRKIEQWQIQPKSGWRKILDLPINQQAPSISIIFNHNNAWLKQSVEVLAWLMDLENAGIISQNAIQHFQRLGTRLAYDTARVFEALARADIINNENYDYVLHSGSASRFNLSVLFNNLFYYGLASQNNFDAIKDLYHFYLNDINDVFLELPEHLQTQENLIILIHHKENLRNLAYRIRREEIKTSITQERFISIIESAGAPKTGNSSSSRFFNQPQPGNIQPSVTKQNGPRLS